jgi:hypothetical protein
MIATHFLIWQSEKKTKNVNEVNVYWFVMNIQEVRMFHSFNVLDENC